MPQLRTSKSQKFRRDAWVEINLENLEFNLKQIYQDVQTDLMPVVKADAYGHGASVLAPVLEAYDFVRSFGVASIDEALALREIGIKKDILVLGVTPIWAYETALKNNIQITIVDCESLSDLDEIAAKLQCNAQVQLKLDTGMNRIGFREEDFAAAIKRLDSLQNIQLEYIFSHFADIEDEKFSNEQFEKFEAMTKNLNLKRHISSSAIARTKPEARYDLVRCGIELYGLDNPKLKPLMSLFARINYIKDIKQGETVSYKRIWRATRDSKIATLPLGYADGIPRAMSNKMQVQCRGQKIEQVGIVTMDQLMIDVTDLPDAKLGDQVALISADLPASNWAQATDTISYEIVTRLNLRLPKIYTRPEVDNA